MATKTIVRCRPGMKSAAEAAFAGIEVVVDDSLTQDWVFGERELDVLEEIEAEIEQEERQEADPKNAHTFLVPLALTDDQSADPNNGWLAVRIENNFNRADAERVIGEVKLASTGTATAAAVRQALKKAGANVLSVSVANYGVTYLGEYQ